MVRNFFLLALLGCVLAVSAVSDITADFLFKHEFENFKSKFGKSYSSNEEEAYRFTVFKSSIERAVRKNKEHDTNVFGVTKFSDLTEDEFRGSFLSSVPKPMSAPVRQVMKGASLDSSFDWREKNVVTEPKNQGTCGNCWAHSTIETIESAWAIAGNSLTEFSVQQVTSCDSNDGGCRGGWPSSGFEYVESAGGLATEADYPYSDGNRRFFTSACKSDFTISGGSVSGWSYATPSCSSGSCDNQDEETLAMNLNNGQPISIAVDASQWSDYTGGVFPTSACSSAYNSLDHAVQLVGYTNYPTSTSTSSDSSYWIVRNSWGTWGEDGYIYIPIGSNACGLANVATMVSIEA